MTPQELKQELERTAGHDFEAWLRKNLFDVLSALEKAQRVEESKTANEQRPEDIQCPVCGYYCLGKGGNGCIDKPKLVESAKAPVGPHPDALRISSLEHQVASLEKEILSAGKRLETCRENYQKLEAQLKEAEELLRQTFENLQRADDPYNAVIHMREYFATRQKEK